VEHLHGTPEATRIGCPHRAEPERGDSLTFTPYEVGGLAMLTGGVLGVLIAKVIAWFEYRAEAPRHVNCTVPGCQYQRHKVSGRKKTPVQP